MKDKEFIKSIDNILKEIVKIFWEFLYIIFIFFISALAGLSSEKVIYHLNKPLGLGYAHYASYAVTAGFGMLLYMWYKGYKKSLEVKK